MQKDNYKQANTNAPAKWTMITFNIFVTQCDLQPCSINKHNAKSVLTLTLAAYS